MCKSLVSLVTVVALGLVTSEGLAQRGVGDAAGMVRLGVRPEMVELTGQVIDVKIEPCLQTTGRSLLGAHFLLKTPEGQTLNIHLGPATRVESVIRELVPDTAVTVHGFRTDKMQEGHYVAQQIRCGDHVITLRDETLRPVWAGGAGTVGTQAVRGNVRGFSRGVGRGQGRGGMRSDWYLNGVRETTSGQGPGWQGR